MNTAHALMSYEQTAAELQRLGITRARLSWQAVEQIERRAMAKLRAEVLRLYGAAQFPNLAALVAQDRAAAAALSARRHAAYAAHKAHPKVGTALRAVRSVHSHPSL